MTKNYTLEQSSVDDENKVVQISEEVTQTKENRVTVGQLRKQIADKKAQIKKLREEINGHVDEIQAINDNTDIAVKDIPEKIAIENSTPEKITIKE
jgi:predicted  nucleic acid-binding Zn-ribbon protein